MNNTLDSEQEIEAARALKEKQRNNEDGNEKENNKESLREQVMKARSKSGLEKNISKNEDELIKKASAQILNFLWGLVASVAGFIFGFLGLNLLAFFKAININLFGLVNKIKFRLADKAGLFLLDLLVVVIIIVVLGMFILIFDIIKNPASHIKQAWQLMKNAW